MIENTADIMINVATSPAQRPTMRRLLVCVALLTGCACADGPARASVIYNYVTDQTAYNVAPNGIVTVQLYLKETVTGADTSLLAPPSIATPNGEDGLVNGGLSVLQNGAPSSPTTITGIMGDTAEFAGPVSKSFTATSAKLLEGVGNSDVDGAQAVDLGGGVREINLGTLTLKAGSLASQTTTFVLAPRDNFDGNTLTFNNLYDLDMASNGGNPGLNSNLSPTYSKATSSSFIVNTVPEPGALGLIAGTGLMTSRRRRNV